MSAEVWKLERDLCRCCHAEGAFKSLYASYIWLDVEVVYSNMLRECFGIELAPVTKPSNHMCTICDACIRRLCDVAQFKHQVLMCERRFRDVYLGQMGNDSVFKVDVKVELPDPEEDNIAFANVSPDCHNGALKDDLDSRIADDGTADDDGALSDREDVDFKLEDEEEVPIRKPPLKKTKRKKTKITSAKVKKKTERSIKNSSSTKGIKVGKRPRFRLQEGTDYKQVGDEFHCCKCDKILNSPYYLRRHVRNVHLKIPKYTCPVCSKMFLTLAPFVKHKLTEHDIDERQKCNACDNAFTTKVQLKRHINSFHMLGEKSKCDMCDYESFSVEALYKHKFKHKTVKDYHCTFCRKSFVRKTTLQLHERIHTGDRRKVCKVCGQAFVQKASLNYHMTKYHPGVDF